MRKLKQAGRSASVARSRAGGVTKREVSKTQAKTARSARQFRKQSPAKQAIKTTKTVGKRRTNLKAIEAKARQQQAIRTPVKQQASDGFDMFSKPTPVRNHATSYTLVGSPPQSRIRRVCTIFEVDRDDYDVAVHRLPVRGLEADMLEAVQVRRFAETVNGSRRRRYSDDERQEEPIRERSRERGGRRQVKRGRN